MSGQWHPDTEEIAALAAGPISGFRARRHAAHVAGCERCAAVSDQLGAMRSMLASVPSAAMPDAFERQISTAIGTEAAARAAGLAGDRTPAGVGAARDQADRGSAEPARPPRRGHARARGERGLRLRPAMAFIPVAACLIVAVGYLATRPGTPTSSGPESNAAGSLREPANPAASASAAMGVSEPEARSPRAFTVIDSGTRYQASTLRAQVRGELKSVTGFGTLAPSVAPTGIPSPLHSTAASSASNGVAAPPGDLIGCVLLVTGGATPQLVDKALYQGKPVYVIAVQGKAWVVGRGCTAADTELITSASLTAAP